MTRLRLTVPLTAAALVVASCADCDGPDPELPAGNLCGTGQIAGSDYAVDADNSRVVLSVFKEDAFGCGALHSHVVNATIVGFEYDLDDAAAGEVKITVPAKGLDPDDPDLREELLPEGENQALSDGDRQSIRGSVAEEVKAGEFADLVFTLKGLSAIDGEGTATLVSDIAGATSEVPVAYAATKDGDVIVVEGTATIAGGPHGIPRNALGFCVNPDMDLTFKVTLTPGAQACAVGGEAPVVFTPTVFPDEECGNVGYNVVYNNVVGPRCMGCHGGTFPGNAELLRGGATEPLITWDDFRTDSVRNQGRPLYETAHEYANLVPGGGSLSMPPVEFFESNPLVEEFFYAEAGDIPEGITSELALFNAWATTDQGRNARCETDVEKKVFTAAPVGDCTTALKYSDANDAFDGLSASDFMGNCLYCHAENDPSRAPSASTIATYDPDSGAYAMNFAAGDLPVTHPFYVTADGAPLNFWETSVQRVKDNSMPVLGIDAVPHGFDEDPSFLAFEAWVNAGACPDE
jgi:hypothetical protein